MDRSIWRPGMAWLGILLGLASAASASSLPASYAVTDLGVVPSYSPLGVHLYGDGGSPLAPGGQTVTASDGSVYAFPRTSTTIPGSGLDKLAPVLPQLSAPYAYSVVDPLAAAPMNANGLVLGAARSGIDGHDAYTTTGIFAVQRQADGSLGTPRVLWTSQNLSNPARAVDINVRNEVLGQWADVGGNSWRHWLVADAITGEVKNLPIEFGGWYIETMNALDDRGRILAFSQSFGHDGQHALLLTPEGVSSDPIATPEPSALMALGVAGSAWVVRRRRGRRSAGIGQKGVDRWA